MDWGLDGKVVLITGGSKGIGYACAEAFHRAGAKVAIASRSQANLDTAVSRLSAKGMAVLAVAADFVAAPEAGRAVGVVERSLGPIHVLVNSAGAAKNYAPDSLDFQAWHDAMDAKYFSYIHAMQAVLPLMASRNAGSIVNVIGQGGRRAGSDKHIPGGAANAALMLASTGLAKAFGPKGIRVNAINPGGTITERHIVRLEAEARRTGTSLEELEEKAAAGIPLGRLALPQDIADAAVFLASARAAYITGVCIAMDGGKSGIP